VAKKIKPAQSRGRRGSIVPVYELEVALVGGPITEAFSKKNPHVIRTIQIRGDQTLAQLHEIIFEAFDRFDEHMYEFQIGGKGPNDPKAKRYVLSQSMEDSAFSSKVDGAVAKTRIGDLDLKTDDAFGYWFDFGDDWWHQINVMAIHASSPSGDFPKITARIGESPAQYANQDEDEEDWDDESE
jgi:hypothetical protein